MDKDRAQTEQILELTLDIIYLLTGEDYAVVKKTSDDGQNPVLVFPSHSVKTKQKILEVIEKIMELLAGEMDPVMGTHQRDVPVLCITGIPHRKVTPSITIIKMKTFLKLKLKEKRRKLTQLR